MNQRNLFVLFALTAFGGGTLVSPALANTAPVVSNVTAGQRGDSSKLVDIHYTLVDADGDPCTVWVGLSDNGGTTWQVPARTFSGDLGANVIPGAGKIITWDAGLDMPGKVGTFRVRVWADDGKGSANMVLVAEGPFPYQNVGQPNAWTQVNAFLIAKYETTVQQYCEFLNAGGNDDHWDQSQEITRNGTSGNYYYGPYSGRQSYPIRFVSCTDAEHYAAWRSAVDPDQKTYRLPTEQEWEKAAAWDQSLSRYYLYPFQADTIDNTWCNYNNSRGAPSPVGDYNGSGGRKNAKSPCGCYDMGGNLFEWTSSIYGNGPNRVFRGGCWSTVGDGIQCQYRFNNVPTGRGSTIGFRLATDAPR